MVKSFGGEKSNDGSVATKSNSKNISILSEFFSAFSSLPKGVFAVSLFGLFLGTSTTMVYSQIGLFLKNEIGATTQQILSLDGMVEALSFIVRIFSGPISDFLKERKLILYIGCFFTLFSRSLLVMANSWLSVIVTQSVERIGNGIQATPRDALIADITPKKYRAGAFGFSRSCKTIGSLMGTLIGVWIMIKTSGNYHIVFGYAVIPVVISIICLTLVKNNKEKKTEGKGKTENIFKRKYLKSLDFGFWKIIILALIFELGHFSEHSFPLYAACFLSTTISGTASSFVSIGQVLMSFPIGILADRYGKRRLIAVCMLLMILANLVFISARFVSFHPIICVYAGAFLWGGQMTAIQGLFLAIITEKVDSHLRATAIGIYCLMVGFAYWTASNIGGRIWDTYGSTYSFLYSILFSIIALCLIRFLLPKSQQNRVAISKKV